MTKTDSPSLYEFLEDRNIKPYEFVIYVEVNGISVEVKLEYFKSKYPKIYKIYENNIDLGYKLLSKALANG